MPPERPNILFLFADQWIHDWMGFRGHPWVRTPHLDRLAAGAHCFTNAFCATPLCSPSRGTTLTAKWPHQCGVLDNLLNLGNSRQPPLGKDQRTWIESASAKGYRVGYYGKWHLGVDGPMRRGAKGPKEGLEPRTAVPTRDPHADERGRLLKPLIQEDPLTRDRPPFYRRSFDSPEETQSGRIASEAIKFLEGCSREKPWFLTASFYGPHFPHDVPAPFWEMFRPDDVKLPPNFDDDFAGKPWYQAKAWWTCQATRHFSEASWRKTIAAYLGMLALVDSQIGRVIDAAEKRRGERPLYIIFAADHGEMLGAHGCFDKGPYFYDEVWRIPLVMRTPESGRCADVASDALPSPVLNQTYVNLLDLGGTLFALTGSKPPSSGRDLRETLSGRADPQKWPQRAYGTYNYYNGHAFAVRAVRNDRWKYVYHPQAIDELYDLHADPGELHNRADDASFSKVLHQMQTELFAWMQEVEDPLVEMDPEQLPPAGTFRDLGPSLIPGGR